MDAQFSSQFDMENDIKTAEDIPPLREPEMGRFAKKPKKNAGARVVATALVFSLLGGVVGAGGTLWMNHYLQSQDTEDTEQYSVMVEGLRETSQIKVVQVDTDKLMTASEVYAANVGSTVGITTSTSSTNFWGFKTTSAASGSGFIISTDGYILTNYHVIEDADSVAVALYSGETYDAALVGYDESNDIAVLKIDAEGLAPVILGDSDSLNIGDSVVAIGNPLGELTFSLTAGAVSAKDREVTLSSSVTMNLLQTDCAINSGNSGGALFNMYGEVVGITNAKYSGSSNSSASIDNIGFAIPINSVRSIVESIIEKGYISKSYIGVSLMDVSEESQLYGVPAGIAVQSVSEGSPAEEGGLLAGDVITAVNGESMDRDGLVNYVGSASVGDTLILSIYRQGETLEVTVTIGEQIQSALANEEEVQQEAASRMPQSGMPFGGFRGNQ